MSAEETRKLGFTRRGLITASAAGSVAAGSGLVGGFFSGGVTKARAAGNPKVNLEPG